MIGESAEEYHSKHVKYRIARRIDWFMTGTLSVHPVNLGIDSSIRTWTRPPYTINSNILRNITRTPNQAPPMCFRYWCGHVNVRYDSLTDYIHVLKLIGSDCTTFGIDCTAYLSNVYFRYVRVQAWYEHTFDTSSVHRPAFSWGCDVPRLPFLGCDDYELYLAGLLHWPKDGVAVQVSLCLFGVNEIKVTKEKIRHYIVLQRAQGPTLLDCNYADTCFTAALGSVHAGRYTQVQHISTSYQQVTTTRVTRGPQVCSSTLLFFVLSKNGLENRQNLVEHPRCTQI